MTIQERTESRRKQGESLYRQRFNEYGLSDFFELIERDWQSDHSWTEHFGPTSPTIDHIVPLSKGGSHTWDNVQVAHAICNSRKGDKYEQG